MGERLNISITKGDKVIANSYFHWSGFTISALELTNKVMFALGSLNPAWFKDEQYYAIAVLQHTGAGLCFITVEKLQELKNLGFNISSEEIQEQKNLIFKYDVIHNDYEIHVNRNSGFISISPWDIKNTEEWEEESVHIDLENKIVDFKACRIMKHNELKEYLEDTGKINNEILIKEWPYPFPINQIPFKEWDRVTIETLDRFAKDEFYLKQNDEFFICIC